MYVKKVTSFDNEKYLEKRLRAECGKLNARCYKWVSPGVNGVPDRIVIHQGGTWFVEVKTKGNKPTKLQQQRHAEIREAGGAVLVIDTVTKLTAFIDYLKAYA